MVEESVVRFYELYVDCHSTKQKNVKLEETFQQLDQVFSSQSNQNGENSLTQSDFDDGQVIEHLRMISDHNMK